MLGAPLPQPLHPWPEAQELGLGPSVQRAGHTGRPALPTPSPPQVMPRTDEETEAQGHLWPAGVPQGRLGSSGRPGANCWDCLDSGGPGLRDPCAGSHQLRSEQPAQEGGLGPSPLPRDLVPPCSGSGDGARRAGAAWDPGPGPDVCRASGRGPRPQEPGHPSVSPSWTVRSDRKHSCPAGHTADQRPGKEMALVPPSPHSASAAFSRWLLPTPSRRTVSPAPGGAPWQPQGWGLLRGGEGCGLGPLNQSTPVTSRGRGSRPSGNNKWLSLWSQNL